MTMIIENSGGRSVEPLYDLIPDLKSSSFYNTDCAIDMYAYDKR
jgi:hypothetical protein